MDILMVRIIGNDRENIQLIVKCIEVLKLIIRGVHNKTKVSIISGNIFFALKTVNNSQQTIGIRFTQAKKHLFGIKLLVSLLLREDANV